MDYEKKYKEALERAKDYYKANQKIGESEENEVLSDIFPELQESEDARIRKAIHIYLDWLDGRKDYAPKGKYTIKDMIAWLEKQSNSSPVWKYKKDNKPLLHDSLILNKYGCVAKSPSGAIVSDVWVLDYDELATLPREIPEKQGQSFPILSNSSKTVKDWTEEDEYHWMMCLECVEECATQEREDFSKTISWLKQLKQRLEQ